MLLTFILPPFIFLAFAIGVLFLLTRDKRTKTVVYSALVAFSIIGGFFFYTYGYLRSGAGFSDMFFATLRGTLSTARMFVLEFDHGDLTSSPEAQWITDSKWLQVLFWLCHLSALIVVQSALIYLFGQKIIERFRMCWGTHSEVYIIKGKGQNAIRLGENIATHDGTRQSPDTGRLVVFLIEEEEDERQKICEKVAHVGGIVQSLHQNCDILYYARMAGLGKWYRRSTKYHIVLMPDNPSTSADVHQVATYANEMGIKEGLGFYAISTSDWDRQAMEAISQCKAYPYTFHLFSEAEMSARQMVEKRPPYQCESFHFDENGVTTHDFTVLILGFGETGQHALLRLIMNGQFVGSRMQAVIIDKDIDRLRDRFLHRYPGVNICCRMEFKRLDVPCEFLYKQLNDVNDLDYIVISLGCGEMNKQAALDIRLHYDRIGKKMPLIALADVEIEEQAEKNIFGFGRSEDIFRESLIIREEADRMAKAVNDVYSSGKQQWYELDWLKQESNRAAADFIPAMLKLANLDEKTAKKKDALTENDVLAEVLAQTEHLRWNAFHAAMGYRPMSLEEIKQRFETPLPQGEKQRDDQLAKRHLCLVAWEELDKISEAYRDLASLANNAGEQKRDFKQNDRDIIKNIPKFLYAAKKKEP